MADITEEVIDAEEGAAVVWNVPSPNANPHP